MKGNPRHEAAFASFLCIFLLLASSSAAEILVHRGPISLPVWDFLVYRVYGLWNTKSILRMRYQPRGLTADSLFRDNPCMACH